ncbi:MAG: DUF1844 domain-containing protein [Candidatus Omnitrophica bacterium]|nr:DUF1844 domain-containing protein [Candidatus Omnitrophota bacterium]HOX54980.1 DUF1844 domain-containing protein [Candidatus Omnitrophota bacterium]
MDEQNKKKVDESWKDAVEKEKSQEQQKPESVQVPEVDFMNFITSLSLQSLISLGEIESPFTGNKEVNIKQARFLIDTLDMIKEKTKGNLTDEESKVLDTMLYELKMKYIEKGKEV